MKRPKLKKASKRMSCSKRYKIQKKVREHNRKVRKETKKKGITKRTKKDPGVPNVAPFREEVLREAENKRNQLEELKKKNKLEKQQKRAEKRKKEATTSEGDPKAKKAKREERVKAKKSGTRDKNSRKFLCAEVNKVIRASDIICEVLDARDPLSCRCPQLEENAVKSGQKLVLVLNKIDLVPKENLLKWLQCLQREFPTVAFKCSTQLQDRTVKEKKQRLLRGAVDQTKGVTCYGSTFLLQLLKDYADTQGVEKSIKVAVVGFPNVGKSSLLNSLKGIRACNSGVQRGTTRNMQEVHLYKNLKVIDSPSIIASPSNSPVNMALRSLPITESEQNCLEAVRVLLKRCNSQQVMLQYTVPDFRNSLEFLTCFAKKRGYLQKGGVPDTEQAAQAFLSDWTGAKLSYHSKPQENASLPSYLSDSVVAEMHSGWDACKLQQGNAETIKGMKFPAGVQSIMFTSAGPTAGLLNEEEVKEVNESDSKSALKEELEEEQIVDTEDENSAKDQLQDQPTKHQPQDKPAKGGQPQDKPAKGGKVMLQPVPVSIDLTSTTKDDDAYDFNVDFI